MKIFALLVALALMCEARADESPITEIIIQLVAPINMAHRPRHVVCKVNYNYFTVSRWMLTHKVTITARNGVAIHFPWQAHQCRELSPFWVLPQ